LGEISAVSLISPLRGQLLPEGEAFGAAEENGRYKIHDILPQFQKNSSFLKNYVSNV
jgi:hypothetical protein